MGIEYTTPAAGSREEPGNVPGEDECTWKDISLGANYEDDIDNAHPLPERE